jgi:glycosyltransferase involved in cell wall biosynthesis
LRIIHLSYNQTTPPYTDPEAWLKKIQFSIGVVEELAKSGEQIVFHHIQFKGILERSNVTYNFLKLNRWQLLLPIKFNRIVKETNPNVVIIHGLLFPWQTLMLHRQLGKNVKLVAQHHAEQPFKDFRKFIQQWTDKYIQAYLFTSKELGMQWVRAGQIKDQTKIHVVMEASSPFYPTDKQLAKEKTKVQGKKNYLWVGRLDENKDPLIVVRAFLRVAKIHKDINLYMIYQSRELEGELKKIAQQTMSNITLVGKVEHDELLNWYNSVDFIISSSHYEGSGISVCEAMSCGCIPILTDIPSFRMMTKNGSLGILYPVSDEEALTKALVTSVSMELTDRQRVIDHFNSELSFKAIAEKIKAIIDAI